MGLQNIKSYFKLYDMTELSPEVQFKTKSPQYFWAGPNSSATSSRRTSPTPSASASRRNSVEDKNAKTKSASHAAMRSAYGI